MGPPMGETVSLLHFFFFFSPGGEIKCTFLLVEIPPFGVVLKLGAIFPTSPLSFLKYGVNLPPFRLNKWICHPPILVPFHFRPVDFLVPCSNRFSSFFLSSPTSQPRDVPFVSRLHTHIPSGDVPLVQNLTNTSVFPGGHCPSPLLISDFDWIFMVDTFPSDSCFLESSHPDPSSFHLFIVFSSSLVDPPL